MANRLRICIVSSVSCHATGGIASYIRLLAQHLASDCTVSAVSRFELNQAGGLQYARRENARVLDNGTLKTHLIRPVFALRPVLRQLHHFTSRRGWRDGAVSSFVRAYQPALRRAMPDDVGVIHYVGTGWELLGFAALAEARRRGAFFSVLPAVHPDTWGDSPLDVRLYNQANALFTLSNHEREHLMKRGVEGDHIFTTGLGPASDAAGDGSGFRARYGLQTRPLVLFIGRKDRGKGYHALRQAMNSVLRDVPNACLIAIGPDCEPPYPPLPTDALLDLGTADEQTKADALAACDVFCMPSIAESFGIVYIEAWAFGKPVVGGPAPAVRELIADGVSGYVVEQDPERIAATLVNILSNPKLAHHLGTVGKELQQSRYTWKITADFHQQIFRQGSVL